VLTWKEERRSRLLIFPTLALPQPPRVYVWSWSWFTETGHIDTDTGQQQKHITRVGAGSCTTSLNKGAGTDQNIITDPKKIAVLGNSCAAVTCPIGLIPRWSR
jgi:hypothetical protein